MRFFLTTALPLVLLAGLRNREAITQDDGAYSLSGLVESPFTLTARIGGYSRSLDTPKLLTGHDQTWDVQIPKGLQLRLTVTDKDYEPIAGLCVELSTPARDYVDIQTIDANGDCAFSHVQDRIYDARVLHQAYPLCLVSAEVTPRREASIVIPRSRRPSGRITGTVQGLAQLPQQLRAVLIASETEGKVTLAPCAPTGIFLTETLPPGQYSVCLQEDCNTDRAMDCQVSPDSIVDVGILFVRSNTLLTVRLHESTASAASGALVWLQSDDNQFALLPDATGSNFTSPLFVLATMS